MLIGAETLERFVAFVPWKIAGWQTLCHGFWRFCWLEASFRQPLRAGHV
jgi:hypothetical protein